MGEIDVVYKIPLIIEFEARFIQKVQGPNKAVKTVLWVDPNAWIDQPDYEEDDTESSFIVEERKCMPIYTKTKTNGDVVISFNHDIEWKYAESDIAAQMQEAGAIQMQLVSAI